ncbi:MAG: vegetative protein [Polyangia bacterium]|jgi:hypothetical protein
MAEQQSKADTTPEQHPTGKAGGGAEKCAVEKCKQPVRAKGYCRKHYLGWRRGKVGTKHRYNTCSKEGCRKPALAGGVCAAHKKGAASES